MVSKDGFLGRTIEPYKFGGRSVGGMIRVITMYSIILFRTIHAALYIIRNGVRGRTVSLIVGCIFGVIGTIFVIMSVAALGAAQGRRRVLGINWVSRTGRRTHTRLANMVRRRVACISMSSSALEPSRLSPS
jgi:hypothetical protein